MAQRGKVGAESPSATCCHRSVFELEAGCVGQSWRRPLLLRGKEGRARRTAELPMQLEEGQQAEALLGAPQDWPSWVWGSFFTAGALPAQPEPAGQKQHLGSLPG